MQIISGSFYKPFEFVLRYSQSIKTKLGLTTCNFRNLDNKKKKKIFTFAKNAINHLDNKGILEAACFFDTNNKIINVCLKKDKSNYVICIDEQEYSTVRPKYDEFERIFYYDNTGMFDTKVIDEKTYINMIEINNYLGYTTPKYLINYYGSRSVLTIVDNIYANISDLQRLLICGKIRKPGVANLVKLIVDDIQISSQNVLHCPEVDILSQLVEFLKEQEIEYKLQYCCLTYKIDMYLPQHKIAIEIDEMGHQDRNQQYEILREDGIKSALNCKFLRINPHKSNFRIAAEIGKLTRLLYQ